MNHFNEEEPEHLQVEEEEEFKPAISPVAAAFIGLIGGFFLYQIGGAIISLIAFGVDLENAPVAEVRLMTIAGQILFILLPALLLSKWIYFDVGRIIKLRFPNWKEVAIFSAGVIILTPMLQSYLFIQNYFIEILAENSSLVNNIKTSFDYLNELVEKTYGNLLSANSVLEMAFVVITISIVPAITEETMFRGFIQRSFQFKIKPVWAALTTAVFFGLFHFNPYGLIPLIILGFYFGFAAYQSGTLIIPVILHFLNNFIAVVLFYSVGDDDILESNVPVPTDSLAAFALVFIVLALLFAGLIFVIRKYYSQEKII